MRLQLLPQTNLLQHFSVQWAAAPHGQWFLGLVYVRDKPRLTCLSTDAWWCPLEGRTVVCPPWRHWCGDAPSAVLLLDAGHREHNCGLCVVLAVCLWYGQPIFLTADKRPINSVWFPVPAQCGIVGRDEIRPSLHHVGFYTRKNFASLVWIMIWVVEINVLLSASWIACFTILCCSLGISSFHHCTQCCATNGGCRRGRCYRRGNFWQVPRSLHVLPLLTNNI